MAGPEDNPRDDEQITEEEYNRLYPYNKCPICGGVNEQCTCNDGEE